MINMEVKEYIVPKTLKEAYDELIEDKGNKIIGGGAWLKISVKNVNKLISLDNFNLDYIREANSFVEIGAMSTLRTVETNSAVKSLASGILSQAINSIMGITIRNLATIGGSVMGKFAFSDILGVLLVLDCKLEFYMLGEISIYDYMEMKKIPNDILLNIKISKTQSKGYFKKVSKTHLDFSMLNLAIVKSDVYKIAVGSRPLAPDLAVNTANFLNSQVHIDEEVIKQALEIALEEVKLSSNLRAQEDYRRVLMSTYLKRGIREVSK